MYDFVLINITDDHLVGLAFNGANIRNQQRYEPDHPFWYIEIADFYFDYLVTVNDDVDTN